MDKNKCRKNIYIAAQDAVYYDEAKKKSGMSLSSLISYLIRQYCKSFRKKG